MHGGGGGGGGGIGVCGGGGGVAAEHLGRCNQRRLRRKRDRSKEFGLWWAAAGEVGCRGSPVGVCAERCDRLGVLLEDVTQVE